MDTLKIIASHPVQYQVPFYKAMIGKGIDIQVAYYHQGTAGRYATDIEFGIKFSWDIDLLSGYRYRIFSQENASFSLLEQLRIGRSLLPWALKDREIPLLLMGWFSELIWFIWFFRILLKMPVIVVSETTIMSFNATQKPKWRTWLLSWLLRHSSANLFIGKRNYEFLQKMGVKKEKLFYVPYSIDNQRFSVEFEKISPERKQLCLDYGLDPNIPTYLFCGKFITKKRPLELLDAFLAAGLEDKSQLLFIGEGVLRKKLENEIKSRNLRNVHILGFLNQSKMPLAYVLGEILCLISAPTETWGLVVNEALACSRPVIISDTIGCGPDLVDETNGWVTHLDDRHKLTETLISAFDHRSDWSKIGKKGKLKVKNNTFQSMAEGVMCALKYIQIIDNS